MRPSPRPFTTGIVVLIVTGFCLVTAAAFAQEDPSQAQAQRIFRDASKVIIDGKAEANGVLGLTFEPQGGEAKLVRVNVVAKTKPKEIAKDLAKQLEFTVGSSYKVKSNDNKVTVTAKNNKTPVFFLGIEEQALSGVSVRITKD